MNNYEQNEKQTCPFQTTQQYLYYCNEKCALSIPDSNSPYGVTCALKKIALAKTNNGKD